MSNNIEVCFRRESQQRAAWRAIGWFARWTSNPEEKGQLYGLRGRYRRLHYLTPGITAAVLCSSLRPQISAVPPAQGDKSIFLWGPCGWSLYRIAIAHKLRKVDRTRIQSARRGLGLTMFGPSMQQQFCLVAEVPGVDVEVLRRYFDYDVEAACLADLVQASVRT